MHDNLAFASSTASRFRPGASLAAGVLLSALMAPLATAEAASLTASGSAVYTLPHVGDIEVNPFTDRVYVSSGAGGSGVQVFNFSLPGAPTTVGTSHPGTGVAVNPSIDRYYTIDGSFFGGRMREYNGTTLVQTQASANTISGCGASMAINRATGIAYGATQCSDSLHRYNPATNTITAITGLGMVGSQISVNDATNRVYALNGSGGNLTRVFDGLSLATLGFVTGRIADANEVTNRLYANSLGDLLVLDGTTHAVLSTLIGEGTHMIAVDGAHNWFFTAKNDTLKLYDGATNALMASLSLGSGLNFAAIETGGDGMLYGVVCGLSCNSVRAFEVTGLTTDVPEPHSLALLGAGLAGFRLLRRRQKA